jgi:5-methyltetrahydrofolate--homocysteine methyltransferase
MAEGTAALDIINDTLLSGMKVVGELFGSGQMQLPFVLQSAETMKTAVAHLEPHMDKVEGDSGKGRIVLATVKGDVHDIGKNLVDIILTNNGYEVHNLGIKVSIADMIEKALEVKADAIGMSGLLVKSTLIMRDNLEELNTRELGDIPVLLGGAALTRSYVERDLREVYEGALLRQGRLRGPARDGPHRRHKRGDERRTEWGRVRRVRVPSRPFVQGGTEAPADLPARRPGRDRQRGFKPAVPRTEVREGHPDRRDRRLHQRDALFRNQWQFRPEPARATRIQGPHPAVAARGVARPRPTGLLAPGRLRYFAANGDGNDLVIWTDEARTEEQARFSFPRQSKAPYYCIADFFRPMDGAVDYAGFSIVTMGHGRVRAHRQAVRRRPLPGLPAAARPRRRDGRGAGRVLAPAHAGGVGLRPRGRAVAGGPVPPAVPRWALLVGLPGLPGPGGQRDGPPAARRGAPGAGVQRGDGLPVPARADHVALICHHPQAKYFVAR